MEIVKNVDAGKVTFALKGRLDTVTAPQLESEVDACAPDAASLEFDFSELDFLTSAGLRVLLKAQKAVNRNDGTMVIRNVNDVIMDVFDATGFIDILTVE